MPFINGKYTLDAKTQKKWFNGGAKIVNKSKVKAVGACPSEYDEQCALVKWLTEKEYKFTAIPNSTWTTYSQQMKNKSSGVRPGLPDLLVIVRNRLVWIELKKIDRKPKKGGLGGVSQEQAEWIGALNACVNCTAIVCYGAEDAKGIIQNIDSSIAIGLPVI